MTAAEAIALITTLLTLAGLAFLLLALLGARAFRKEPQPAAPAAWPSVSVLKPIKGWDPGRYEAFASHCRQQYSGRFELLLGLTDPDDAEVLAEVEHLRTEFPQAILRTVACGERLGTNGKVSTLVQMLPHALGEVVVINDADIVVSPAYLSRVVTDLQQPGVGMVTAPYLGRTAQQPTLWARLESLGISTDFLPGVLTSRLLDRGIRFGMGSTLALRTDTVNRIGGLQPLLDLLADDYEVGARVHRAGMRVVLSPEVVSTSVPQYTFRQFWDHQLRWARGVRDVRRAGYLGLCFSYAVPWALANVVASGAALPSLTLLSLVLLARVAVALNAGVGVLRDGQLFRDLWLVPLRDCVGLLLWAWSFAGKDVVWRGQRFQLQRGRLVRR